MLPVSLFTFSFLLCLFGYLVLLKVLVEGVRLVQLRGRVERFVEVVSHLDALHIRAVSSVQLVGLSVLLASLLLAQLLDQDHLVLLFEPFSPDLSQLGLEGLLL